MTCTSCNSNLNRIFTLIELVHIIFISGGMDEYLKSARRKRSQEMDASNPYHRKPNFQESQDPLRSKLCQAPINISKSQKMLKTGMLSRQGGPLFYQKIELHIPPIRYNFAMQNSQENSFRNSAKYEKSHKNACYNKDKWRGWNSKLETSLNYWQKRYPSNEIIQCSNRLRF